MVNAKYTVVLKTLLDNPDAKKEIDKALSTYPLYEKKSKEEYIPSIVPTREQLNNKILNFYKYREIGFETVGRFLDELEISMNEIMPFYNQMLMTADLDYNIIYNVDYTRETKRDRQDSNENTTNSTDSSVTDGTETNNATSSSTGENTTSATDSTTTTANINNHNKNVESGTPQGSLNIGTTEIDSVQYADKLSFNHDVNTDNGTSEGSSESSSTSNLEGESSSTIKNNTTVDNTSSTTANGSSNENEEIIETTKGNFGVVSSQDLVAKYREIIVNIEQKIINDERISELFMSVF